MTRHNSYLRKHVGDFNILTALHQGDLDMPLSLLMFYSRADFDYVQARG